MDLGPILSEVGTTVAIVVLFVWLFRPFVNRLMDNLDRMSQGYVGYVEAQVEVATGLRQLCTRLDQCEETHSDQVAMQDGRQGELAERLEEVGATLRGLQMQQQAHEGRSQKRHEQMLSHADERHAELIGVLKHLNGKTTT